MPELQALPQQVFQALEDNLTVVTANQRAARDLTHAFDLRQRARGCEYWEPPAIFSWSAWLNQLWNRLLLEGRATALLLNSAQEHTLWRRIIAADTATASLRPVDALAQSAASAWKRLHDYPARKRLASSAGNTDTRAFARWCVQFERHAERNNYLTEAQLPDALRSAVAAGDFPTPSRLLLVGFDSQTPAQAALLAAMRSANPMAEVRELTPQAPAASLMLAEAPDQKDELDACARWLRNQLEREPEARLAVIVPAIDSARAEIDRHFRERLAPELRHIAAPSASEPFEFSLGVPLAHTPLAACALDILRWAAGPLPLDRITGLLLSPHFASGATAEETLVRAEFDANVLRSQPLLSPEIALTEFSRVLSHSRIRSTAPVLSANMAKLTSEMRRAGSDPIKRTFADWAAAIHDLLEAAGWAQPAHLDSVEFQARRKWQDMLDELATLDFEGERVSFAETLKALERIATDTLFAPESRHAPVQIMGPLECAGSSFDAVWFLRANDMEWPAPLSASPLLPWLLQRELGMPGADAARDMAHAGRITERIAASAPSVTFSYSNRSGEGTQRPSAALAGLTLEHRSAESLAPATAPRQRIQLVSAPDISPIPAPSGVVHGGAGVLKAQAQCCFRAFAEKRLLSSALEPVPFGLDARRRGNVLHTVLDDFWSTVQTQSALNSMTRSQRTALLDGCIHRAFDRAELHPAPGWPTAYLEAERLRLIDVLLSWLEIESARSPFTVLLREETLRDVKIGPLRLNVRVDRIDQVEVPLAADENPESRFEVILDYKTSDVRPSAWLDDRPDEPQLPLYAIVGQRPHLAGVAFAIVRPGDESALRGYASRDGILPKPTKLNAASFEAQIEEWRQVLIPLAEDFYAGIATVAPKRYPATCKNCDQRLLCRVDPFTLNAAARDEEQDSDSESGPENNLG